MKYTVTVKANASKTRLIARDEEAKTLTVAIHAPRTEGKANEALIAFLAEEFKVPKSRIVIEKGLASKVKRIQII